MAIKRQSGASLISLMIGLLVSMLSILAVMTMHKSLMRVAVEAKSNAVHDSMVASAMMELQTELLNAGFGMETTTGADVRLVTMDSVPTLVWRYIDPDTGNYVCRGVREVAYTDTDSGTVSRRLETITGSACDATSDLAVAGNWAADTTLAQFKNQTAQMFTYTLTQTDCTAYGLGVAQTHFLVNVDAPSSAEVEIAKETAATSSVPAIASQVSRVAYNFCLVNTHL